MAPSSCKVANQSLLGVGVDGDATGCKCNSAIHPPHRIRLTRSRPCCCFALNLHFMSVSPEVAVRMARAQQHKLAALLHCPPHGVLN